MVDITTGAAIAAAAAAFVKKTIPAIPFFALMATSSDGDDTQRGGSGRFNMKVRLGEAAIIAVISAACSGAAMLFIAGVQYQKFSGDNQLTQMMVANLSTKVDRIEATQNQMHNELYRPRSGE